ncbi:hypothetical protein F5146DRAFT_1045469 [Armillaria mellea]|nr:hypothetical protein F5146DRAFT_1045469 [Armillaria mellea]
MNISHSLPSSVTGISFSFLSAEDIRRISVKQIVNPILLDDLNRPNSGGLYDPALGPSDRQDICATCRLTYFTCPGHFGHIELPAPVFHPLFMTNMYNLLRGTCLFCHRFKMSRTVLARYAAKFKLLEYGLLSAAQGVDDLHLAGTLTERPKGKGKGKNLPEEEETFDVEPEDEFISRVEAYVHLQLSRASSSKRDDYKDALVYQARKDLINEFLKSTILNKCQNKDCSSFAYTFRKESHTKIIEYDLSEKQKRQQLKKRPDVLLLEKAGRFTSHQKSPRDDSDVEMGSGTDSEGEGDDLEENEDGDEEVTTTALPRAANGKIKTTRGRNERIMAPEECRAHLRRLFRNEETMCSLLYGKHGAFAKRNSKGLSAASADMFFLEVIPVAPTRFRPPASMGDVLFEHPQNELLAKVLNTSYRLRDLNLSLRNVSQKGPEYNEAERKKLMGSLLDALLQMQVNVNSFMDSTKNPAPVRQGKLPPAGVKQGLEKKEGLFRKHMMGKRVNYAARSVISPDVNIEPNEIGIPPVFATKLTFPEPVTAMNVVEMRQRVIAGPREHPGATIVEYEDGHQVSLDKLSIEQRTAIANQLMTPQTEEHTGTGRRGLYTRTPAINKKVHRHLRDGDMLILNRQPTLHKPSMMAHKARILQGEKTIRMHYANCWFLSTFNRENQVARAEAQMIANTDNQYLVPTSGNPLRGLIQDHVVAGVWMTTQDAFFEREEYFQLLCGALRADEVVGDRLVTLPPTIWKPRPLWTGKQIISTVLKNITPRDRLGLNLTAGTKVPGKLWGPSSKEDIVIFRDGELLCGVLDKAAFGASEYGLVHSVYELYGADVAGQLLGILSRLFTKFLQHRAFTCRMDDLTLTPVGDVTRRDILDRGKNLGTEGSIENFPSLANTPKEDIPQALKQLLEEVLRDDSKMAGLDMTVKSKLGKLTSSISDACMPNHLLRKFPHNHMQAMTRSGAKGSEVNARQISCGLGQQELEGRRVPVMVSGKTLPSFRPFETRAISGGYVASRFLTGIKPQEFYFHSVKTSRSGYLQRCLIKHLEGIRVHYDHTVRGSDSSVYQFHYGGDSLDVTKQKHLQQFDFLAANETSFVSLLEARTTERRHMKKALKALKEDPKQNMYDPAFVSEGFARARDDYIKKNPHDLINKKGEETWFKRRTDLVSSSHFKMLTNVKYMRSLVEPGEAVGLLASQGVGEPSTQMTLNTFHFAGHGAANVTLGIPRLREIVMTASQKPKTPSMSMKVRPGIPQADIDMFCKRASKLTLSQVIEKVTVTEQLKAQGAARRLEYLFDIAFFPEAEYIAEHEVDPSEILACFATKFPLTLKREIVNEMKRLDSDVKTQMAELGRGKKTREQGAADGDGGDDDAGEVVKSGMADADDAKRARQRKQQATYDEDDEEEPEEEEKDMEAELEAEFASDSESDSDDIAKARSKGLQENAKRVADLFMGHLHQCTSFDFTESRCTFTLEERTCRSTIIRQIPGITDCFQVKSDGKSGDSRVTFCVPDVEGVLEDNETYSNDIYAILKTYGVEMARAAILKEMSGVFGVYSIKVDQRHLELIADYMTFEGGYKPFNRKGISTNPSPLLKASYETTAAFLSDATLYGDFDDLSTPSGNIVLGRPNLTGTGVFDVVMPIDTKV